MKLTKIFNKAILLALDATTASAFKSYNKFAVRPNLLTYLTGRWHYKKLNKIPTTMAAKTINWLTK